MLLNTSDLIFLTLVRYQIFYITYITTRQNSGEFIFQQDCHSAQDTLVFWHYIFHKVV